MIAKVGADVTIFVEPSFSCANFHRVVLQIKTAINDHSGHHYHGNNRNSTSSSHDHGKCNEGCVPHLLNPSDTTSGDEQMVQLVQCTSPENCENHQFHLKSLSKMNRSQSVQDIGEKRDGIVYPPKLAAIKNKYALTREQS